MIHKVNALKGSKHRKKDKTTVPSMSMTCFLYLMTLPVLLLFLVFWAMMTGFSIRFLAMML